MKLTNISLAILVAIGLVACGGSDDKNNQTTDNNNAGNHNTGNNNPPPPPPKGDSGLDPKRVAPGLTVPDDMKAIVAANKRIFVSRSFNDSALGYVKGAGFTYVKENGTDPANVKLGSVYNYSEEGDLITAGGYGYKNGAVGAISVGDDPSSLTNNTFVMVSPGKYIRVAAEDNAAKFTPKSKFYPVVNPGGAKPVLKIDKTKTKAYDQDEVVFIANADTTNIWLGTQGETNKVKTSFVEPGSFKNSDGKNQFQTKDPQVVLSNVKVFGKTYEASTVGQNLDFTDLALKKEIQTEKVTGDYQILNLKSNVNSNDDKIVTREVTLGNIKAYNLPYSIAFVTTNVDEKKPAEKDIFNLGNVGNNGAFQVLGFETVALPQNGRTFYKGKSFSANTTGDVTLYADLFEDRAGIGGVIDNRKDSNGKELATLTLATTPFTKPNNTGIYNTSTSGAVTGDSGYANVWTVQLYGPDAEEAAGTLVNSTTGTVKEVFNTQREGLTNQSNDSTVTP